MNAYYRTHFVLVTIMLFLLVGVSGCKRYGSVSPVAYDIAKSLYSTCNRQDEKQLPKVEKIITEKLDSKELSESEHNWLMAIVDKAKSKQWKEAMLDSRLMLEEQVH